LFVLPLWCRPDPDISHTPQNSVASFLQRNNGGEGAEALRGFCLLRRNKPVPLKPEFVQKMFGYSVAKNVDMDVRGFVRSQNFRSRLDGMDLVLTVAPCPEPVKQSGMKDIFLRTVVVAPCVCLIYEEGDARVGRHPILFENSARENNLLAWFILPHKPDL
jgi:hypothetical protein